MTTTWRRPVAALLDSGSTILERGAAALRDGARAARFLRARLEFEVRPDDTFVASYPRSGTTWTQLIVHYLVTGASGPAFDHISDVSPWFERCLAHRREASGELAAMSSPRVFKTHLPPSWLPTGARYIYVRRQPEDVAVSYYHLYRRYLRFDGDFSSFFDSFVRGNVQYRSWFDHVADWEAHGDHSAVLLCDYEDMIADTATSVRVIAAHVGVIVDDARVAEICRLTEFAAMKADEHKFDHIGELCRQWGIRDGDFLRAGAVTGGAGIVTPPQRERLHRARRRARHLRGVPWRLPAFLH